MFRKLLTFLVFRKTQFIKHYFLIIMY